MKQAEENQQCFSMVQQLLNPTTPGGLTQLMIPSQEDPTQWTTIHDKEQMEEHLLQHSRIHFSQAHRTPFTRAPLKELLRFDGITMFGDNIFEGHEIPPELDIAPATRLLLHHQQSLIPTTEITKHLLDFDLLMQGFQKWPEQTTTLPLGRHLGIYKSLLKDKPPVNPPPEYTPRTHGTEVMHYIYRLMKLAVHHTFPFERWWTVWNMYLEKEPGNPKLDKL